MTPDDERLITVRDVYGVIVEHMKALDELWPDADRYGPRKVHIVELIDGIKLRLVQRAKKNSESAKSTFEIAAEKIIGGPAPRVDVPVVDGPAVSPMEEAARAAKARMAKYSGNQ